MITQKELIDSLKGVDENGRSKVSVIAGIELYDTQDPRNSKVVKQVSSTVPFVKSITRIPGSSDVLIVLDFSNGEFSELQKIHEVYDEAILFNSDDNLKQVASVFLCIFPMKAAGDYMLECRLPRSLGSDPTPEGSSSTKLYIIFNDKFMSYSHYKPVIDEDEFDDVPADFADYADDEDAENEEEDWYEDPAPVETEDEADDVYD